MCNLTESEKKVNGKDKRNLNSVLSNIKKCLVIGGKYGIIGNVKNIEGGFKYEQRKEK